MKIENWGLVPYSEAWDAYELFICWWKLNKWEKRMKIELSL